MRPNLDVPVFKIFVGWRPKKSAESAVFFGLGGTLLWTH